MHRHRFAVLTALLALAAVTSPAAAVEPAGTGSSGRIAAAGSGLQVAVEPAIGTVGVVSAVVYALEDDVVAIVAEVKNNTSLRRVGTTVRVRFLDAADQDLGVTYSDQIRVGRLAYGARSPFWIELVPPDGTETLVVDIGTQGMATSTRAGGALTLRPTGSFVEGDMRIWTATLTNPNAFAISLPSTYITTYDADGEVVDAWLSGGIDELAAGASVDLEIPLFDDPAAVRADFVAEATRTGTSSYVTSWNNYFDDLGNSTFRDDVEWLAAERITGGCGAGRYCPTRDVRRDEMAAFLARALGLTGEAPDAFTDDEGNTHEANIDRIAAEGITGGCGGTNYCPAASVKRDQMASFLARALELTGSAPNAFSDDTGNTHEANIDRIAQAGITGGCGGGKYCPSADVTRGQMAAFLRRAFED